MATIKNLVYSAGNLVQWEEADDTFSIEYLNGKPVSVTSKSGPWLEHSCELIYDGQGKFTGFTKEIKTKMLPQIIAMASGMVTATINLTGGSVFSIGDDKFHASITVLPSGIDDVTPINAAIQKVYAAGGGEVRLVAGEYWLKSKGATVANKGAIQLESGIAIRGAGKGLTIIKCHADLVKDTPMVRAMSKDNIGVYDLKLDGNRTNRPTVIADDLAEDEGISFISCTNSKCANLEITDTGQEAIDCDDNDGLLIDSVYAHDTWGNAFHLGGTNGTKNGLIRNCVIDNVSHGRGASALSAAAAITLLNTNMVVENTRISNSYRGVFHTKSATNARLSGLTMVGNTREDIFSENYANSGLAVRNVSITKTTDFYAVDLRSARALFENVVVTSASTTVDAINTTLGASGSIFRNCRVTGGRIGLLLYGTDYLIDGGKYTGAATDGIQVFVTGSYATLIGVIMAGTNAGFNISDTGAWAYLYGCLFPSSKCRIRNSNTVFMGQSPGTMEFASGGTPTVLELTGRALAVRSPNNTRYLITVSDAGVLAAVAG